MNRNRSFVVQLVIVGGFLTFLYIFFALATSIYRDYQLEVNIQKFEDEIAQLAGLANQKPKDVEYFQSVQYKDKYAKENLNLLNPGEKLIIIPQEDRVVKTEKIIIGQYDYPHVLELPNRNQWWEYFFGRTLSLNVTDEGQAGADEGYIPSLEERMQDNYNVDEESLLDIES
ncbi:hypothetical protein JW752_01055 [Candidatus Peregrinibacteria bacterium]|nr:hypothetical protein [Candidatus Peregrinibacteria bacterium]